MRTFEHQNQMAVVLDPGSMQDGVYDDRGPWTL